MTVTPPSTPVAVGLTLSAFDTTSPSTTPPTSSGGTGSATTVVVDPSDNVAPALLTLPLTNPDPGGVEGTMAQVRQAQAEAAAAQATAEADLTRLRGESVALDQQRQVDLDAVAAARQRGQAARDRAAGFGQQAEEVRKLLEDLAMASYVGVGTESVGLESATVTDSSRRVSYSRNVADLKAAERRDYLSQQKAALSDAATADRDAARLEGRLSDVDATANVQRAAIADAQRRQREAVDHQAQLGAKLQELGQQVANAHRTAKVVGLDMPLVVLDALWKASATINTQHPACHMSWSLLAAISRIESGHGTSGGASVAANGDVVPRILGPVLDGKNFALIPDTDHGVYDGDPVFDRAVGPMQFIPSSWAIYGADGNGDGKKDPNNYYDAALAAADHLCRGGADTATDAGRRAAVLSYNQSEDYLAAVSGFADSYARFAIPPVAPAP